jgi:hypothetical protein
VRQTASGLPVIDPPIAAVRAALWARSDRETALILCMAVQQRIVDCAELAAAWSKLRRGPRKAFLDHVVLAVTDGAQALSELDFGDECKRRGLPQPTRQSLRRLPRRRAFLDAAFDDYGFSVEIDGSHHFELRTSVEDMLRQNDVVIGGTTVLRIPVLGYHLHRDAFMGQVERLLRTRGWAPS